MLGLAYRSPPARHACWRGGGPPWLRLPAIVHGVAARGRSFQLLPSTPRNSAITFTLSSLLAVSSIGRNSGLIGAKQLADTDGEEHVFKETRFLADDSNDPAL